MTMIAMKENGVQTMTKPVTRNGSANCLINGAVSEMISDGGLGTRDVT